MSQADDIRDGIATNLQALSVANGGKLGQISPYFLSNPTPPCAYVSEGEIDYDLAMGGGEDELTFMVVVLVGNTSDIGAQQLLGGFRDPNTGIKHAVESDRTLGGVVDTLRVTKASEPKVYAARDGAQGFVGCEFTVEVHAHR